MPFDGRNFAPNEALEKLDRVVDLLGHEDRWCKGTLRSPDGRRCIVGALQEVKGYRLLEPVVLHAVRNVTGRRYARVVAFNDDRATTHELVMTVLHQARRQILAGELPPSAAATRLWHRCRQALAFLI